MISPNSKLHIHIDSLLTKNKTQIEQLIWIFNINIKLA